MVRNGEVEATLVKARFGTDVRKLTVHHNDDLSYNDLLMMMLRIFKITHNDSVSLKYKDQEGDMITMVDDHDLLLALQNEPSLSLVVSVDGDEVFPLKRLQSELEMIRDSANELLDMLKRMGECSNIKSIQERPDTPVLNESIATIQPSVHEQVNNTQMHPSPPCTVNEVPFESISHKEATVPPAPMNDSLNEPTTEVDITSHTQPPITSMTSVSEHSVSLSQGMEYNQSVPTAPIPTLIAFRQHQPQAAVPPVMPNVMHTPVPIMPQAQVQGMPPPQQYQQQQQQAPPPPTQMQQSFGGAYEQQQAPPPPTQIQQSFGYEQQQVPQGGNMPFPSAIPPPPSSTPSGGMQYGQMATQQQAVATPPVSQQQQQQYSASSTPTPMQPTYQYRSGTPSYGVPQQQQGGIAPPPTMPPSGAPPPMMPFAAGQGTHNPFGRGAAPFARPPFNAFQ